MEISMQASQHPCLESACCNVQYMEQTQEIRLTDDLPDIGKILGSWGQIITRGKEWRADCVQLNAGMIVHILYGPDDGTENRCVDTWIPFQIKWELPDQTPDGIFIVNTLPKYVDTRSINPRKMIVRAGIGALGQALYPSQFTSTTVVNVPEGVQLLRQNYPMRFFREAGEKNFLIEEDLSFHTPIHMGKKPIYYSVKPEVFEQKVLGNKIAFRGCCNLHVLYREEGGSLCAQDFSLPFSQFAELNESYSSEAQVVLTPIVTNLELESDESRYTVRCSIAAQYLVDDITMIESTADAYCIGKEMRLENASLDVPSILERRIDTISIEQTINASATQVVDICTIVDFPKRFREGDKTQLEMPGSIQILYYAEDGSLQSTAIRIEGKYVMDASESVNLTVSPGVPKETQISFSGTVMSAKTEVPISIQATGGEGIPMVTKMELAGEVPLDAHRPSLILKRVNKNDLWDIAKEYSSTVDAIQQANKNITDWKSGQFLLIPIF